MSEARNEQKESNSTKFLSSFCDECGKPSFKIQRDASNHKHSFCEECWKEHVAICGNEGKPYGF